MHRNTRQRRKLLRIESCDPTAQRRKFDLFDNRRFVVKLRVTALAIACALIAVPVYAHHSFAMFDMSKNVVVTGQVKDFQWTNPHMWIQLVAQGADGKPIEWSIEGNSPSVLARQGWTKRSLKVGDTITVTLHPLKDGSIGGDLVKAVLADGKVVGAE
jgi:hypothetical protein